MRCSNKILAFIQLGRLHFLIGGIVLHFLGVVIALYTGASLDVPSVLWGQIAFTTTQLMTHYANDYFDLNADRKNLTPTRWSGGSRVLVEGKLPEQAALLSALILGGIAFTAAVILSLFIRAGIMTFVLLLLAQGLAWFYSAPPVRLHSRGLGEVTTVIVVTFLTPLLGYYLQAGTVTWLPVLAVVPLCCFQFAMLLSIEFPDAEGDRQANKNTLVVRLGAKRAAHHYIILILLAYIALPLLVYMGLPVLAAASTGFLFPLAGWQVWRVWRGDWKNPVEWNTLAFYTIVLLMGSALAELMAFILLLGL